MYNHIHVHLLISRCIHGASNFFLSLSHKANPQNGRVDYDKLEEKELDFRPKILILGGNLYPRKWDYARSWQVTDKYGTMMLSDVDQINNFVASNECISPSDYCDNVTSRGTRGVSTLGVARTSRCDAHNDRTETNDVSSTMAQGVPCRDSTQGIARSSRRDATSQQRLAMNKASQRMGCRAAMRREYR
ncbi:serine hydroxymethyltransferase, partial [Striga asiatica]